MSPSSPSIYPAFSIIRQRDVSVSRSTYKSLVGRPPSGARALGALDRVMEPSRRATEPLFLSGAGDPLYSEVSGRLQRSSFANAALNPAFFHAYISGFIPELDMARDDVSRYAIGLVKVM